jgi:hypothetical protein
MITESEGYACKGKDQDRKQTETAAMTAAKYNAAVQVLPGIYGKKVADFSLNLKIIGGEGSINTSVNVIRQLQGGWYNDAALGDCYKVKIKAEVIPNIKTTGIGAAFSSDSPLEIQKQETFIAAFFASLRNMAEIIARIETRVIEVNDKKTGSFVTIFHERIGEFEIYSQTKIVNFMVNSDFIDVSYKGQKFVVLDYILMYPAVELAQFIKWNNPPKIISDIRIEDVKWNSDGTVEVVLSHTYKPKKVKAAAPPRTR